MILEYLIIGLGGAFGAILRVSLSNLLPQNIMNIPSYILLINIIGCFLMGLVSSVFETYFISNLYIKYFIISGFLGAFTTFSAFALDFAFMFLKEQYLNAFIYVILSICLSILAFLFGFKIIKLYFFLK